MNFSITPQLEHFVREYAVIGGYNNSSEVIREALRLINRSEEESLLKFKNLRQAIKNGEVTEITTVRELGNFFENI